MLYSKLVHACLKSIYGSPPAEGETPGGWGLVLVADGVGGFDLCGEALRHVVGAEGLPLTVRVVPWGHGLGSWHADLTKTENHAAKARLVAGEVTRFREGSPGAPAYLLGKSGGCGIVVRALELLPEDSVENVVLLAPALSPGYDLSRALAAVRGEMTVFWSPFDLIVLGAGTRLFGTIDRVKCASAGLKGFRMPDPDDAARVLLYKRLRQVRWRPGMIGTGYLGGHLGPDSPAFLKKHVLPLLRPINNDPLGIRGGDQAGRAPRR